MSTSPKNDDGITTALAVAGFDPSSGAGISADLRAMQSRGVYAFGVITAMTVQSTAGVGSVQPVEPAFMAEQLDALLEDAAPAACKTGMLPDAGHVEALAQRTAAMGALVIDPVARSTAGVRLASASAVAAMKELLLPNARLITPNLEEASELGGIEIRCVADAIDAAAAIHGLGAASVCVTGGHWQGRTVDVYYDAKGPRLLDDGNRIGTAGMHGTGCFFAAVAAAEIALGAAAYPAVEAARSATRNAIRSAVRPGGGMYVPWP